MIYDTKIDFYFDFYSSSTFFFFLYDDIIYYNIQLFPARMAIRFWLLIAKNPYIVVLLCC